MKSSGNHALNTCMRKRLWLGLSTPADEIPGDLLNLWRFRESRDFVFTNVPPKTHYLFHFLFFDLVLNLA